MKKVYVGAYVALLTLYVILAFALPVDPAVLARYEISSLQAKLLSLTTVIPVVLIYLTALYGFVRVRDYANKIRGTHEGPAFDLIAKGLLLLVFGLPIRSIITSITSYIKHAQPDLLPIFTIFRQYISVILAIVAVVLLARGARRLYDTLKRPVFKHPSIIMSLIPIALASIYTWLITSQAQSSPGGEPYYVPVWVVVLTIAIPYVFVWCTGLWAAIYLYRYQFAVKGVIYKRAIDLIAKGIAVIMLISVLIQFLTTLSGLLNRLDLTPLLGVIYLLLACYVVGYGFLASGAKKLKRIEEV